MSLTKKEFIKTINVNDANFDHISKTKTINGSLLLDIERVMESYADQEVKAFLKWVADCDFQNQTPEQLWSNYINHVV